MKNCAFGFYIFSLLFFGVGHLNSLYPENSTIAPAEDFSQISFRQLIFVSQDQNTCLEPFVEGKVVIDSALLVPDFSDFIARVKPYLDSPLTIEGLNELLRTVESYYFQKGYPVVIAKALPGQDVTEGSVKITVLLGRLNHVEGIGARYFSNRRIAANIRTQPGDVICSDSLDEDLYRINNNPFRCSKLIYQKGEKLGETDLIVDTKDQLPFRPYVGYQNTGNKLAGRSRYLTGFNWGNVWGLEHQLNYQFTRAKIAKHFWSHSGGYNAPLPWRHLLKFFGYYSKTHPHMTRPLNLTGKGWQTSGRYEIPFAKWKIHHNFILGYDFKRTNNFLSFVKNTVYDTYIDVSQFMIGYCGKTESPTLTTDFGAEIFCSPGGMTRYNKDRYFEQERPDVKSRYTYGRLHFDIRQHLPMDFSWYLTGRCQFTRKKLLPSEEFSVGGYLSVRGYLENQFIGDNGILLRNEIRTPSIPLKKHFGLLYGDLQFLAFLDYGKVYDADSNILNRDGTALASIGPGFRYCLGSYVNVWFDYGIQLKKALTKDNKDRSRIHLGATLSY